MRKAVAIFTAVVHLLLLDAVTKELAVRHLKDAPPVVVVSGFFDLAYVENLGCAWGLFQGSVWPLAVFGAEVLAFVAWRRRDFFMTAAAGWRRAAGAVAACALYAGIVGNLIDRVFRGHVVDFLDFHWGDAWHFPCFNVADVCITVAAGLLLAASFAEPSAKRSDG